MTEHGDWLKDLPVDVPTEVGDWELQTSHSDDYMADEMFMENSFVEWSLDSDTPYYLQFCMNIYPVGVIYSLKIERPLGGSQLLDGKCSFTDCSAALEKAVYMMERVGSDDVESGFYGGSWFPVPDEG